MERRLVGDGAPAHDWPWSYSDRDPAARAHAARGHGASATAHRVKISAYRAGSDWCIMCDASGTDS